ncbi:MAG: DUF5317 domain-containing protein [Thermovenabulum sp.]|uniref:DUF5317 domain-containing protein n=1 Tax=Thermovenabulum sp. TaxID=3100335 RepID=UPI003C7AF216
MLVDVMIISVIIGLLRKGSFSNLAKLPLKNLHLIFLSFMIRYIPFFLKGSLHIFAVKYNIFFVLVSYGLLMYAITSNFHLSPMKPAFFGVLLNALVIVANGGKMPVSIKALETAGLNYLKPLLFSSDYLYHTVMDASTKLGFLGDIIPLPPPYPRPRVVSIGDIILGIGIFWLIQLGMLKKHLLSDKI